MIDVHIHFDAKMQFEVYYTLKQLQVMIKLASPHIKITKHKCLFVELMSLLVLN